MEKPTIKYHLICEFVEAWHIKLIYGPSEDMIADMLTKGLPILQFKKLSQWAEVIE